MLSLKIRRKFIEYFVQQHHRHLPSSAVVPHQDPTLLFCNAGMNQFKSYFLGQEEPPTPRAVTSQKCIRVGGKHNDLENVGHTTRHLTFFEMLGNFSFGDYFKTEAIDFAWEVVNQVLELDIDRLWASVYVDDDEAFELWKKHLPENRIVRIGAKDNFWQMGDVGPCGPCSELFFDRGAEFGAIKSPAEDIAGERYFEFWNLVFMQYNKNTNGELKSLPSPCVDTGMGLERIVSLKMGVDSVFETDIFSHLIAKTQEVLKVDYAGQNSKHKAAFHVIADHLRCLAFAIADGVQPSNIDRGYVLRKVLRRAVRYGRLLGAQKPFMADVLPELVQHMHEDYPELNSSQDKISEILSLEEEAFLKTIKRGGNLLNQVIKKSKEDSLAVISGDDAFLLKDTYGMPIDEIELVAVDNDLTVDMKRFKELERQAKEVSKKTHKEAHQMVSDDDYRAFLKENKACQFIGDEKDQAVAKVVGIQTESGWVNFLNEGQKGQVILDQTPFYAEKGGQVGDQGILTNGEFVFKVLDTQEPYSGIICHKGVLEKGTLKVEDGLQAQIDSERRRLIEANHTATHILHWALQKVAGEHVKQAGSYVGPDRLRFDFSHHKALTEVQIREIEDLVNCKIRENIRLNVYEMPFQEVQQQKEIKQFFGDKYGLVVRVVDADFSKELCGGCHVKATGDIGLVRIVKESSIAAGVRRLEAVSAQAAIDFCRESETLIEQLSSSLKSTPAKLSEKLQQLILDHKNLQEHLKSLAKERNQQLIQNLVKSAEQLGPVSLYTGQVHLSKKDLREFVMQMSAQISSGVCVICCAEGESVSVVVCVSKDLIEAGIFAKDILSVCLEPIAGKGGGKKDFAQAGGQHPSHISQVFENVKQHLAS